MLAVSVSGLPIGVNSPTSSGLPASVTDHQSLLRTSWWAPPGRGGGRVLCILLELYQEAVLGDVFAQLRQQGFRAILSAHR